MSIVITEKDCKIEYDGDSFVLYLAKSKKELKENSQEFYKIGGYFTRFDHLLIKLYKWRKDKKYPFTLDSKEIKSYYKQYKESRDSFLAFLRSRKSLINNLKTELYNEYKWF